MNIDIIPPKATRRTLTLAKKDIRTYSDVVKIVNAVLKDWEPPMPEIPPLPKLPDFDEFEKKGKVVSIADIKGLDEFIDGRIPKVEVPTDYAKKSHKHSLKDLDGKLPLARLEHSPEIKRLLTKHLALRDHSHAGIERELNELGAEVDAIEIPDYSKEIKELKAEIKKLEKTLSKVDNRHVELVVIDKDDVKQPRKGKEFAKSDKFYVVLDTVPNVDIGVKDKAGYEGTVSIQSKGGVYLLFAAFDKKEAYPITFFKYE